MNNRLELNFTKNTINSLMNNETIIKYLDENNYFDYRRFNKYLDELSTIDKTSIINLFINYNNKEQLLEFLGYLIKLLEELEDSANSWVEIYSKNTNIDMEKIAEDNKYKIVGFETDFRKMDAYRYFNLSLSVRDFYSHIKRNIADILSHYSHDINKIASLSERNIIFNSPDTNTFDGSPKANIVDNSSVINTVDSVSEANIMNVATDDDMGDYQFYTDNPDYIYAFLEVCKKQKVIRRKNSEKEVPDNVLIEIFMKIIKFKKPYEKNSLPEYYKPESVRTIFVSKRNDMLPNEKYRNYIEEFVTALKSYQ